MRLTTSITQSLKILSCIVIRHIQLSVSIGLTKIWSIAKEYTMEIRFGYLIGRFVSKSIYMKYRLLLLLFSLHFISCDSRVKKEYYDNGKLKSIVEVRRNARNGTMCEYFPDGSIKSKSEWKNGVKHGKSETFYSNGNIEILSYWVDGKENGISKRFTRNGVLYSTGRFVEDRKGEVTIFYENGKVNEWQLFDGRNH